LLSERRVRGFRPFAVSARDYTSARVFKPAQSRRLVGVVACAIAGVVVIGLQLVSAQPAGLRIVVIEGENAVNIVQQKTAVAPVVEVRDRNDQPVSGVPVRFAITKGRATFGGERATTVTTNAAGRAAVSGLTPSGAGALQISATAAFLGQTAVATIIQTNVMTVAAAAAVAAPVSGAAGGAGGAVAGGAAGGGISATTIGVVGAAVAGGTLVAVKEINGASNNADNGGVTTYGGPYSGVMTTSLDGCTTADQISGSLNVKFSVASDGSVTGTAAQGGNHQFVSSTCPGVVLGESFSYGWGGGNPPLTGTTSNFHFVVTPPWGDIWDFSGALNNDVVTGTMVHTRVGGGLTLGTVTFSVTLARTSSQ
jgi:hypothetical protein